MFDQIKSLIKHSSIYTVGIVLGKLASFLMIPIYTNVLNPAEYGTLELLSLTVDIIATVIGLGMAGAVMRYYYNYETKAEKNLVISSSLIGSITIFAVVALLCFFKADFFSELIFSSNEFIPHFRIIFTSMLLTSGIEITMVFILAKQDSKKFVTINLIRLILQLSLNILFLVVLGYGVIGVLYSTRITSIIFSSYLIYSTFSETGFKFSLTIYKKVLRFGAPLLITAMSVFMLTFADRYFINFYQDLNSVGIYSLGYKFGLVTSALVVSPFLQIWSAKMFEIAKGAEPQKVIAKVLVYFMILILTLSTAITVLSKDLLRIMADSEYWPAFEVIPVISLAQIMIAVLYIVGAGVLITNKPKYKAYSTLIAVTINIGLNFLLIPKYGVFGAAYATLIAYVIRLGGEYYFSQKVYPINYPLGKIGSMLLIYIAFTSSVYWINIENLVLSIAVFAAVSILFPVVLYYVGIFEPEEQSMIREFVKNPINAIKKFRS